MRLLGIAAAVASALLLAGCATAAGPVATATVPPTVVATSPVATPTPSATDAAPETASCETLISPQTVQSFTELGWESMQEPFRAGAVEVEGGLLCKWADPNGSGEGVQIFGWAPIDDAQSDDVQAELLANGWQTIDTDEGVFLTEDPETAFATGAQGYGLTYQFGDGWVTYADTKQSLLLIQRPGA